MDSISRSGIFKIVLFIYLITLMEYLLILSQLFIDDCINCKIIVAPCDGSVMIRTSKNCSISIVAKQLRFRDCENIQIYSYIESEPVVESCSEIHFGPYNAFLPAQEELFTKANFTPSIKPYK